MKTFSDYVCIVDGKRLTESERLLMLANEEHAALESMFHEPTSHPALPVPPSQTVHVSALAQAIEEADDDDCTAVSFYRRLTSSYARSDRASDQAELTPFLRMRQAI